MAEKNVKRICLIYSFLPTYFWWNIYTPKRWAITYLVFLLWNDLRTHLLETLEAHIFFPYKSESVFYSILFIYFLCLVVAVYMCMYMKVCMYVCMLCTCGGQRSILVFLFKSHVTFWVTVPHWTQISLI